MADIFRRRDASRVLERKSILFMGDSIMRNIYKDLVYLLSDETIGFTPSSLLKKKGEESFLGDKRIQFSKMTRGRDYKEERDIHFKSTDIQVSFLFITKVFSDELRRILLKYPDFYGSYPDVIMINSALWDINRWGPDGIHCYKNNIEKLMKLLKLVLPDYTQVIWMTTPPISVDIRGGILLKQLAFQENSIRFNIMEGNTYTARVCAAYGFDVLDMHYYFTNQIHRRSSDGIHWNPDGVRMMTNIFLTHYCNSRNIRLPGNVSPNYLFLKEAIQISDAVEENLLRASRKTK